MRALIVATLLVGTSAPLMSQGFTYAPGDSVKVTAPSIWPSERQGTIVRLGDDSLTFLDMLADGHAVTIPNSSIALFEINRGNLPPQSHFWKGALIGALSGALLGGVIAGSTQQLPSCVPGQLCFNDLSNGIRAMGGVTMGLFVGGSIGGILGVTVGKRPPYRTVDLSGQPGIGALIHDRDLVIKPMWDPSRHASGIALSARF